MRRFIVELGMGSDLHGGDVTKAAMRAVRDAVSRSCLCGLFEVAGLKRPEDMFIHLKGIQLPQLGEGSSIVVALVSLTVCVE